MPMHNPLHPGGIVRRQCLEPLDLSVTEAAKPLGVTHQALSDLVNEKAAISVEMAIRLFKAFGSSPETWLGMQTAYDLWQVGGRLDRQVSSFKQRSEVEDPALPGSDCLHRGV
jgi:antitoxin HigA-1